MGKRAAFTRPIACSPGPSCSSPRRPKPGPPPRKSFIPSMTDSIDDGRNETSISKEDISYLGPTLLEDIAAQDAGYDADVEIVKPYAIEEPDDETDQTPTSAPTPNLPEAADNWQKELVNSLRGLYCDSDSNETHPFIRQKRGRKRKTDTSSMVTSQDFQSTQDPPIKDSNAETRVGGMVYSPKRRRKKSAPAREGSLLASGDDASTGSSPAVLSPRRNSTLSLPRRELTKIDRMDID